MFFSEALAQSADPAAPPPAPGLTEVASTAGAAPDGMEAILLNLAPIAIMVVLFYVLLIMPQQRRVREHAKMLAALQKGDPVVTGGGLVGTIDKVLNDDEVLLDLGNGVKVTALRATIQGKDDPAARKARGVANDSGKDTK
jgi:preprotein translocase subunit YajC